MPHQCTTCGRTFEDGSKEMLSGCPDCGGNKFQFMPAGAVDGGTGSASGAATDSTAGAVGGTAPKKPPESPTSTAGDARETGGGPGGRADSRSSAPEAGGDDPRSAVDRAAATVREWVGTRSDDDRTGQQDHIDRKSRPDRGDQDDSPATGPTRNDPVNPDPESEDSAQASARSDVVSEAELPDETPTADSASDSVAEDNVVNTPDDEDPGLEQLRQELNSQFESIRIVNPGQYELNLMELYEREEYIIALQQDGKYVIEVPDAWDASER